MRVRVEECRGQHERLSQVPMGRRSEGTIGSSASISTAVKAVIVRENLEPGVTLSEVARFAGHDSRNMTLWARRAVRARSIIGAHRT